MANVFKAAKLKIERRLSYHSWAISARAYDSDLPDDILDALSQLYWSERHPDACG